MKAVTNTVTVAVKLLIELAPKRVVEIDHREMQLLATKKASLCLTIRFHGPVVIQVIPGEVGKHRTGHGQVIDSPLSKCMGGHFHGRCAPALGKNP